MSRSTVMVTGASAGIGLAVARYLAPRASTMTVVARRRERLEALAEELAEESVVVQPLPRDLTDEASLRELEARLADPASCPDIFVNNAGLGMNRRFLTSDLERAEHVVRLDFEVAARLARAAAIGMSSRGSGRILNIASIAGLVPTPFHAVYSATKAAFLVFSEGLHQELRGSGVTVTAACPGVTDTEFFEAGDYETKSLVYKMKRSTPELVARRAVAAMDRGRMISVTDWGSRLLLGFTRLFTRSFVIRSAGRMMTTD